MFPGAKLTCKGHALSAVTLTLRRTVSLVVGFVRRLVLTTNRDIGRAPRTIFRCVTRTLVRSTMPMLRLVRHTDSLVGGVPAPM